jgi:hypothetical protein
MYALTIKQPHVSLIMAGIKTLETRTRDTKIRGRVLIHSALSWKEPDQLLKDWYDMGRPFDRDKYPLGVILGSVEITDSLQAGDWIEKHKNSTHDMHSDYEREWILGDLSSDRWVWVLKDPRPLKKPIACKGQQGFWKFDTIQGREYIELAMNHAE